MLRHVSAIALINPEKFEIKLFEELFALRHFDLEECVE